MKKEFVVVTGAAGYLGQKVVEKLRKNGNQVLTLDLVNADFELDLTSSRDFFDVILPEGSYCLVHLAAQLPGKDKGKRILQNSKMILSNLMENLEPERVLFISSTAVYPLNSNEGLLRPDPWEVYGRAKYEVERSIKSSFNSWTIFRLGTLYDSERVGGIAKLIAAGLTGKLIFLPNRGRNKHPFVNTDDAVRAISHWVENPGFAERQTIDIVARNPVSFIDLVSKYSSVPPKIFTLPKITNFFGWDSFPILGISRWHFRALGYDQPRFNPCPEEILPREMINLLD